MVNNKHIRKGGTSGLGIMKKSVFFWPWLLHYIFYYIFWFLSMYACMCMSRHDSQTLGQNRVKIQDLHLVYLEGFKRKKKIGFHYLLIGKKGIHVFFH